MAFPDFPTTPILDSFNRANENPLSDAGRWAKTFSAQTSNLRVVGSACTTTGSSAASSYWTPQQFTNFEVYTTLNLNIRTSVIGRVTNPGGADNTNMYTLSYASSDTKLTLLRGTLSDVVLRSATVGALGAGDKILMRGQGTQLQGWFFTGGVWALAVQATDSTYTTGYIGLWSFDTTFSVDDFGGGEIIDRNIAPPIGGRGAGW